MCIFLKRVGIRFLNFVLFRWIMFGLLKVGVNVIVIGLSGVSSFVNWVVDSD